MSIPNFAVNFIYKQAGKFMGGPVGAAIGGLAATTALATEEVFELAYKIHDGQASFHDVWRATTAIEVGLVSYGILGGALGVTAAPSALVGFAVFSAVAFAAYHKNPVASLDALEALFNGVGNGGQPWEIAATTMKAYSAEIERQKAVDSISKTSITQTRRLFGEARYSSPLILDLDGNGVVSTRGVGEGAYFDHDGNGLAEQSGWVGAGDALLVRDLNGNGRIDGGAELFGNQTELSPGVDAAHGFAALGALDSNNDGKVNALDSAWSSLRLWKDANGNGITDDGELIGLGDAGVSSLGVGHTTSTTTDAQGNQHRQLGSFTRSDGSSGAMHDVWFATDAVHHREVDPVEVSAAIAALPDMQGLGNVHSLRQAMARDTTEHLALFDQFGARSTTGFANRIARDYSF